MAGPGLSDVAKNRKSGPKPAAVAGGKGLASIAAARKPTRTRKPSQAQIKAELDRQIKEKLHGHGGFFENLAAGAENSIIGIPNAVVTTAGAVGTDVGRSLSRVAHGDVAELAKANPVGAAVGLARGHGQTYEKVVKPLGQSYAYKYGPLFRGKPGQALHRALVEDPFGTILDIATVASLGSATAAKFAPAEATALREQMLRGPEALVRANKVKGPTTIIGSDEPSVIGGRAVRGLAIRETAVHKALNKLPGDAPVVGELTRYGKALNRLPRQAAAARRLLAIPLDKTLRKLSGPERQATALIARWPLPRLLDQMVTHWQGLADGGRDVGALKIATDPKIRGLYDNPTPRMLQVIEEARRLGEADAKILGQYGKLAPETAAETPWLHMRVSSGAKFEPRPLLPAEATPGTWVRPVDRFNFGRIVSRDGDSATVHFSNKESGLQENVTFPIAQLRHPSDVEMVGGQSIDQLRAELAAAGRPEPVYLHDTAVDKPLPTSVENRSLGGGASPTPHSPVKQNRAILASLGQLVLDPGTLISQHFRTVKYALYRDIHTHLAEQAAVEVPAGTHLPKNWSYLRRAVGPTKSTGETIPYTEQTAGSFHQWVAKTLPTDDDAAKLGDQLTTLDAADAAMTTDGTRLMVPNTVVKQMTGEFHRSSAAAKWLIERPLDVWRAILLNWSPRWLTNNIVGNTFLAALHEGGIRFVKLWLAAVREHGGPATIDRLAHDKATHGLTAGDFAELFPSQVTGTFKGQNMPFDRSPLGRKPSGILQEGLSPIDRGYEQALRRAVGNSRIQKSPEARAVYRKMEKDTRNWRAASKQALKENPALAKKVEQEINARLGDFTSLSAAERNWIRRLIPFYGWYRAILGITLRLPVEAPLRTTILAHLAALQQEEQDLLNPDIAQYDRGSVVVPGGGILKMSGLNPLSTVPQVARQAVTDPIGTANPMIQATASTGRTFYEPTSAADFLRALFGGVYGNLPPVQAVNIARHGARPSSAYDASALDQLLSLVGVPLRHPSDPIRR